MNKNRVKKKDPLGRGQGCNQYVYSMLTVAGILGFFLVWQFLVAFEIVDSRYLAKPTSIVVLFFKKLTETVPDGATLPVHIAASLKVTLLGLSVAICAGVPLGALMGWYKWVDHLIRPLFEILRPIPPVAWIPMTIVWMGIGLKAKAYIIFFAAFVPCVINSYTGVKMTNPVLTNVSKTCGATNFETFIKVGVPSAAPIIFSGVRVALGNAWATLVAAEMLAANAGLGYMISMGRNYARPDIIVLGMVMIGFLGFVLTAIFDLVQKRVLKWRAD